MVCVTSKSVITCKSPKVFVVIVVVGMATGRAAEIPTQDQDLTDSERAADKGS